MILYGPLPRGNPVSSRELKPLRYPGVVKKSIFLQSMLVLSHDDNGFIA